MRKATFDMDVCNVIRKCPEATAATLATYTALREIATEKGSCQFSSTFNEVKNKALLSESGVKKHITLMERRRLLQKKKISQGIEFRLIKVFKA